MTAQNSAYAKRVINKAQITFYRENIGRLCAAFPMVFDKDFPMPLAKGVDKVLPEMLNMKPKDIRTLMYVWTQRREYILMSLSLGLRYNLEGKAVAPISEPNMEYTVERFGKLTNMTPIKEFCTAFKAKYGTLPLVYLPVAKRPDLGSF